MMRNSVLNMLSTCGIYMNTGNPKIYDGP